MRIDRRTKHYKWVIETYKHRQRSWKIKRCLFKTWEEICYNDFMNWR